MRRKDRVFHPVVNFPKKVNSRESWHQLNLIKLGDQLRIQDDLFLACLTRSSSSMKLGRSVEYNTLRPNSTASAGA